MFLQGHYQNAYVTHDIDKARDMLSERYGLKDWINFEMELPLRTPEGERQLGVKVGCAWAGSLQIELIEPVSGAVEPYLPYLPADKSDFTPRFHHISLRRDDYDAMQAEIARLGLPFVCEGGIPDLLYTYVDGRSTFGHYVEFVWASEAGWKMIGWPEGRPVI
ncbi:VOC family protein [Novosphingobium sp. G106]|uniref:VOC family protein n=1 Tax=Novosphingobium sp. G106 TaxID=2849500 RepID=UPI001C2DA37D|nr:VOC family protein [Novosphingobium sp. G106]MBV1689218.1 VOC family protein [Novosphingobium sp. G106]